MKKGFTLIEIIISVGLIALIGTVSMVSFNFIKKNNIEKKLENMSDAILTAVNVYIETNSEIKNELYNNKNGLKIPLSTLENSGLVDFSNIDVSNEFVVTMLGSTNPDDDTCASTYTAKSWNFKNGETIYICEKSDGTTNLVSVADNLSKTSRETYYFRGGNPQNYIKYGDNTYRIISVEKDDSLVLYSSSSFGSTFNGKTENVSYGTVGTTVICNNSILSGGNVTGSQSGERVIDVKDTVNVSECQTVSRIILGNGAAYGETDCIVAHSWLGTIASSLYIQDTPSTPSIVNYSVSDYGGYKIHLKSCMKITNGTGDMSTPYILENKC